ncbi:MAG: Holliday junction branch migration DNA helicase RuvB [Candidatus Omnitrophica bacterium]|nr:Holliday junction branch migration DNA helicase RuvB [Candidatus Omnitrophota bacterium]
MEERLISGQFRDEDAETDLSLRPSHLADFIGQEKLKANLSIFLQAARKRKEPVDHMLFFGPPGLGKTTLAHIIAKEMDANIKTTSGPVLERPGDLAGALTNLAEGDILFIDEIHRLPHVVEEYLYPAMEDYYFDIMIDKGPSARSVRINIPRFTLIGATTRSGLLTAPLRARFGIVERINYYTDPELAEIVARSARIINVPVDPEGAAEIARRSRGTPRVANRLLKRVRDFAEVKADGRITREVADDALRMLEVDTAGLDQMDKKILGLIMHEFEGGPVGINTISVAVGEEAETLEEIYEPYLIQKGFIKRTSSGRVLTRLAYEHLNAPLPPKSQSDLWP